MELPGRRLPLVARHAPTSARSRRGTLLAQAALRIGSSVEVESTRLVIEGPGDSSVDNSTVRFRGPGALSGVSGLVVSVWGGRNLVLGVQGIGMLAIACLYGESRAAIGWMLWCVGKGELGWLASRRLKMGKTVREEIESEFCDMST